MKEFTTKSGAEVKINLAPWADAKKLKASIQREAAASGVKMDLSADASAIIATVLSIDSSVDFDAQLFNCLARCTRNGQKITESTFNDEDARADYYEIVAACLEVNFRPLVQGFLSVLPKGLIKESSTKPAEAPNL